MSEPRSQQRGFALLAVLWVIVGVAALGVAASLAGRHALEAARNRTNLVRAQWRAEDCLEHARAAIGDALTGQPGGASDAGVQWRSLDRVIAASPLLPADSCEVRLRAAGATLDVNGADEEMLRGVLAAVGIPPERADSLADALLDWRDVDDIPRKFGAERSWYEEHGRHSPRNGPLADMRELARVQGFDALPGLSAVLGVEPGRISLANAPLEVLAALPGFGAEVLSRVAERRLRGLPPPELIALGGELSEGAREGMLARYADLIRLATLEPDAWIVEARGRAGVPSATAVVEVRLVHAGERAAIVRRRTWVE